MHNTRILAALTALAIALWVAYAPGLGGPWLFDDYQNFLRNPATKMEQLTPDYVRTAIYSWDHDGPLPNRGLSRLSFGFNYLLSGGRYDRLHMKVTNVALHALNALLLFLLARLLFARRLAMGSDGDTSGARRTATWLALLATAVWALHPIQLSAVLYVVQRMASMAATFVLLGLLAYVAGRLRLQARPLQGTLIMLVGMGACVVLGYFSKENAILLPFLALLCEFAFFERGALSPAALRGLKVVFGLSVALPLAALVLASPWVWDYLETGYAGRPFDLEERLLTQGRVLMLYLGLFFVPRLDAFTLWHDYLQTSTGLLSPPSTLASWLAIGAAFACALVCVRRRHVWAFGVLFFLVGHALESTVVPLELVFEHRNYVPSIGLAVAGVYYLHRAAVRLRLSLPSAVTVGVAIALTLAFVTHNRSKVWSDDLRLAEHLVRHNPDSYRAHGLMAKALAAKSAPIPDIFGALQRAAEANPDAIFALIRMRRLLAALHHQFEREGLNPGDPLQSPPASYLSPLLINEAYARALSGLVSREISRRIRGAVLHTETIAELEQVRLCILRNLDLCFGILDEAMEWTRLAMEEATVSHGMHGALSIIRGSLLARAGDWDGALHYVRRGHAMDPKDPGMREQEAYFLGNIGRFDEAYALLDALERENRNTPPYLKRIARAREAISRMRRIAAEASPDELAVGR